MIPVEEARERLLRQVAPLGTESVPVPFATGRVSASSTVSPVDLPGFDNSAMDGYAIQSGDTAAATPELPVQLRHIGHVAAGSAVATQVTPGTCTRIFTGAPLPPGADAVVMQEDVLLDASRPDFIGIPERIRPWEFVRFRGEDLKAGTEIVATGQFLRLGHIAVLSACGFASVEVYRRPKVAVLTTGDELQAPGLPLGPAQVYESNSTALATLLRHAGALPTLTPRVPDRLESTVEALRGAFDDSDLVVTAGGASVGDHDLVRSAVEKLGGAIDFWRIAMKPGKPFFHARLGSKHLLGVPGNPVSALVTAILLVTPVVRRLQGAVNCDPPSIPVTLGEPLANAGDRRHFVRVHLDSDGTVRRAGIQASHILGSLVSADGLVDVPPRVTLAAGTSTRMILFA